MKAPIQTPGWTKAGSLVGLLAAVLLWITAGTGLAQEEGVLTNGRLEYLGYCATCHGIGAKGDGPMGSLLAIPPADLTTLSKNNKGQFPFWRIYRIIDGREEVRAHGIRAMPVWGAHFLTEEGGHPLSENLVIGRILGLVYYLQSLQKK